jgi:hypothetical protein
MRGKRKRLSTIGIPCCIALLCSSPVACAFDKRLAVEDGLPEVHASYDAENEYRGGIRVGFFDFLFAKKDGKAGNGGNPTPETKPVTAGTPAPEDARPARDEATIVDIAGILSNGNPDVVRDFTLLARDRTAFAAKYADWCGDRFDEDTDADDFLLDVTAYWLVGHDTEYKFGGYIDWKEETEEITAHLAEAIGNLGYPLDVNEIAFTGEEFTNEALLTIDAYFREKGYTLVSLDIGGDCYHLFIVPLRDFDRLAQLGENLGMRFFNDFRE